MVRYIESFKDVHCITSTQHRAPLHIWVQHCLFNQAGPYTFCCCLFISILITFILFRVTAAHSTAHMALPLIITNHSALASPAPCCSFVVPCPFVIVPQRLIFIFVLLHPLLIPPLSHWVSTVVIEINIYYVHNVITIHII